MSSEPLGTWRRPPLAYVVAEVVISPHYSLRAVIPQLQDVLREDYPRTIESTELVFDPSSPPATQPVWRLLSADQFRGVHIGSRTISFHATAYTDSADFLLRWGKVLSAVETAKLGAFVEHAGMRYVDLVVPSQGHAPRDYLIESLRGVAPPSGGTVQSSMWGSSIRVDDFVVQARTAAPALLGTPLIPIQNALPLEKPSILIEAEKLIDANESVGFIDTDCAREVKKVFNADETLTLSFHLHERVSTLFKSLLSDLARAEWI
jgi:uncharacterized protein (TIGR04255 family)